MFSLEHLDRIRRAEIDEIRPSLSAHASRILEIGAGTGRQAAQLQAWGFDVKAIDLASSNYKFQRVFPIVEYDGENIPFADRSFDFVLSSNVLEHVKDLDKLQKEIRRVLTPTGRCIHILPSHAWRIWTTLASFPEALARIRTSGKFAMPHTWPKTLRAAAGALIPSRHGERGNFLTEIFYFHPYWWRRHFAMNGFIVRRHRPMGLFYTGHMVLGTTLSLEQRRKIARFLGSASHYYELTCDSESHIANSSTL